MNPYLLLAPGPVHLHPKVRDILSEPMIHHRTPLFDKVLSRVLERLPLLFHTKQKVYLLTGTGSGGMEALMVNSCNPGDEILVINSGKFGERWVEMGKAFQLKVHELKIPWGEACSVEQIRPYLDKHPIRTVFCQATETSTGVKHPIAELGRFIETYPQTLFMVDGITAVGAYPILMDEWSVDGLVAGSQKAFMLPTGMSFISFSAKAWKRLPSITMPRYYYDVRGEDRANQKGETWFSSNVILIKALDVVLDLILTMGLPQHYQEIQQRSQFTQFCLDKMNLKLFPKVASESVTAFCLPEGVDSQALRNALEKDYNITIMGGQDQLRGKILRIGHMGYIETKDQVRLMMDLQSVLKTFQVSFNPVTQEEMLQWFQKS